MPVIGRLDEQVNRVLIDPVSRAREQQDAPPAPETPPPPPLLDPAAAERAPEPEETGEREELPVWLL